MKIENAETGAISTSDIRLGDINRLRMINPKKGVSLFPFDWMNFYTSTEYNKSYTFEFNADGLSERFLLEMVYYYIGPGQDDDSRDSLIEFDIGEVNNIQPIGADKRVAMDFNGERFYSILETKLPLSIERTGRNSDLKITAVGPDLDIYVSVQNSSLTSLSQEQPNYSNINNGLGVFSYRLQRTFTEFKLNESSAKQLFEGPYTIDRFKCALHGTQSNSTGVVQCRP